MTIHHPKIKKLLRQCERKIMKMTGRGPVSIIILNSLTGSIPYEEIEKVVCEVTGIRIDLAIQETRKQEYKIARQLICFYARMNTPMSYRLIGLKINRRDHTTVMHGINRIKELIDSGDPLVCSYVKDINIKIAQLQAVHQR